MGVNEKGSFAHLLPLIQTVSSRKTGQNHWHATFFVNYPTLQCLRPVPKLYHMQRKGGGGVSRMLQCNHVIISLCCCRRLILYLVVYFSNYSKTASCHAKRNKSSCIIRVHTSAMQPRWYFNNEKIQFKGFFC